MIEKVIAQATRSFPSPSHGKDRVIKIDARAYQLGGNKHPHFSVTAEIGRLGASDCDSGGCLHEEAQRYWPAVKPIIDLHLSNADDGEPMYAEANGFYWAAGVLGGIGEQYHGGSDKTSEDCLRILAEHLRVSEEIAQTICDALRHAYDAPATDDNAHMTSNARAKARFSEFVEAQRDRWAKEAKDGIALINRLGYNS